MLRELITINPRPAVHNNPRRKRRSGKRRARRNPRFGAMVPKLRDITGSVVPAVIGGAGALGVDLALAKLPMIPDDWKIGWKRTALRAGIAFAAGMLARQFLPAKFKKFAEQATAGALVVTAYDATKGFVAQQFPDLALGAYFDSDLSAYTPVSYDALPTLRRMDGMSAYVSAGSGELNGMVPAVR